jgi:hypothetical protein
MYSEAGAPEFVNTLISGNFGNGYGGGIYVETGAPVLTNTTLCGNASGWAEGGGLYNAGAATPIVRNSIVWGNEGGAQIAHVSTAPDVQHTIVEGGYAGSSNLDADPAFVRNPDPGDGMWNTVGDNDPGDLRLTATSPAIDAGANAAVPLDVFTDLDDRPRFVDIPVIADTGDGTAPVVDMGAYEWPGRPPVADAGPDQSAMPLESVSLNGTASSDPDGDTSLSCAWTQTGGPTVMLSNPATCTPTLTAPPAPAILTFALTVTDSAGLYSVDPDEISITVAGYRTFLPLVVRQTTGM